MEHTVFLVLINYNFLFYYLKFSDLTSILTTPRQLCLPLKNECSHLPYWHYGRNVDVSPCPHQSDNTRMQPLTQQPFHQSYYPQTGTTAFPSKDSTTHSFHHKSPSGAFDKFPGMIWFVVGLIAASYFSPRPSLGN